MGANETPEGLSQSQGTIYNIFYINNTLYIIY
jgi:hypothetical protein